MSAAPRIDVRVYVIWSGRRGPLFCAYCDDDGIDVACFGVTADRALKKLRAAVQIKTGMSMVLHGGDIEFTLQEVKAQCV